MGKSMRAVIAYDSNPSVIKEYLELNDERSYRPAGNLMEVPFACIFSKKQDVFDVPHAQVVSRPAA